MNDIKPIETVFKGYRFRSRLEARWAVFLDALGVDWEYEPEGFLLPSGKKYLPDFRVKCWGFREYDESELTDLYIEVKGQMSSYDLERIQEFVDLADRDILHVIRSSSRPVLILGNIPESIYDFYSGLGMNGDFFSFRYIDGDWYPAIPTSAKRGHFFLMGPDYVTEEGERRLNLALKAARSARFEYGETGS